MKMFLTEYFQGEEAYSSHVFAISIDHAWQICAVRNIGEGIVGEVKEPLPQKRSMTNNPIEALHEACFLSYIALKSGKLLIDEVLGDKGIVHEFVHELHLNKKRGAQGFAAKLEHLRSIIPGYEPV